MSPRQARQARPYREPRRRPSPLTIADLRGADVPAVKQVGGNDRGAGGRIELHELGALRISVPERLHPPDDFGLLNGEAERIGRRQAAIAAEVLAHVVPAVVSQMRKDTAKPGLGGMMRAA
jgi:hypothetical protein